MSTRLLTRTERALILRAIRVLKGTLHPSDPAWGQANRLWDDLVNGRV